MRLRTEESESTCASYATCTPLMVSVCGPVASAPAERRAEAREAVGLMRFTPSVLVRVAVPGEARRLVAARKLEVSAPFPRRIGPALDCRLSKFKPPVASAWRLAVTTVVDVCALMAAMT